MTKAKYITITPENKLEVEPVVENKKPPTKAYSIKESSFSDFTFVIPFHYDTQDRLENLCYVLANLRANITDPNIVIIEMGKERKIPCALLEPENISYEFFYQDFKKTELLNHAVRRLVKTPYFVVQDTDVILTRKQLYFIKEMVSPITDCIIPYNGLYNEVGREHLQKLQHSIENVDEFFQIIGENQRFTDEEYLGTGACAVFKVDSFKECGGMNENFAKWGYEDDEVIWRMFTLGKNIVRLYDCGMINHLDHRVVESDSAFGHNHTHKMSDYQLKELDRIKQMPYNDLKNEVRSWGWNIWK